MNNESICYECIHRYYDPGRCYGPIEKCYPPEEECEEESPNFLTCDGCWRFEQIPEEKEE